MNEILLGYDMEASLKFLCFGNNRTKLPAHSVCQVIHFQPFTKKKKKGLFKIMLFHQKHVLKIKKKYFKILYFFPCTGRKCILVSINL